MSDEKKEVAPELSLLEQLKQQRAQFVSQRDFTQTNLNQLVGAVFACDEMIKKHEAEEAKKALSQQPAGESGDDEANGKKQEEVA
ncbi:Uncharacterised protein [uncultured archaeon]|nr:Uncharacterised protein [uncultured archaeon]